MRRVYSLLTALALLPAAVALADAADQRVRMEKLSLFLGEWEGTSWIQRGPEGAAARSRSTELVESRLDGLVYIVEGKHYSLDEGREDELNLHALAVLSAKPDGEGYDWRTHTHSGHGGTFDAEVDGEGRFIWRIEHPQAGLMRYTITLTETTWTEVGERTTDGGTTWHQFFEMNLEKVR